MLVTPLEFIQIQGTIKLQSWTSRGVPYDCGEIYGLLNALVSKYYEVKEGSFKTPNVAHFEESQRRLATLVDQFPPLTIHKLHYLFIVYLFSPALHDFYLFGGFVRDMLSGDKPHDMDLWFSHHLDHKELAHNCRKLGYEVSWLTQDNEYSRKPSPRRSDYGRHLGSYRLVATGYGECLVFDISLCGTFDELGLDYGCNAFHIERDMTLRLRATIMLPVDKYDISYDKSAPSNSISVLQHCDPSIVQYGRVVPLPFVGYEPYTKKLMLTYEDRWYTQPVSHRKLQRMYAAGELTSLVPDKGIHLASFKATYTDMPRYRMPDEQDLALALRDIENKVARPVSWGYREPSTHRAEKMLAKGYTLVD